jgi:hypothetical protein
MRSVLFKDSHCVGYPIRQDIKFWSLVVLTFTVTGVTFVQFQKPLSGVLLTDNGSAVLRGMVFPKLLETVPWSPTDVMLTCAPS